MRLAQKISQLRSASPEEDWGFPHMGMAEQGHEGHNKAPEEHAVFESHELAMQASDYKAFDEHEPTQP